MIVRISRFVAVLAVVAVLAPMASASSILFSTTGQFGAGGTSVSSGDTTVTFAGRTQADLQIDAGDFSFTSFGVFEVDSPDAVFDSFSTTFTLTVEQFTPTAGLASFPAAQFSGKIKVDNSQLSLTFAPNSVVTIGDVTYRPRNIVYDMASPSTGGETTLQGKVEVVPLPAAAWGGMSILGLLGAGKLRKKMRAE